MSKSPEGAGSILDLEFGELRERFYPLKNELLSDLQRNYSGEVGLKIWSAWRIRSDSDVMCSWKDSGTNECNQILSELVGSTIEKYTLCLTTFDLSLIFSTGPNLEIFCDVVSDFESDENYTIFGKNTCCTVAVASVIEVRGAI